MVFNKKYITFVSTSILGMMGAVGTIIADTFFISQQLGAKGITALNIALPIFGVINGIGLMIALGGASLYTIKKAQESQEKANQTYTTAWMVAMCFAILLWGIGMLCSKQVAYLLGADAYTFELCHTYLKVILCFAPWFLFNHFWIVFIRNDGNAHFPMMAMFIGNFMNILLDYIFMYPFQWGIFGSALATGLAPIFGIMTSMVYLKTRHPQFARTVVKWRQSFRILSLGFNAFVNELSSSIVIFVFNLLILQYSGNLGVAAYGVVANYALVMTSIFTGMAQGVQPLFSEAYGNRQHKLIRQLYQTTVVLGFVIGLVSVIIAWTATSPLVMFFNSEHQVALQQLAIIGMRLYFIGFLFAGINIATTFLFSTTEKPRVAMFLSLFRGCIGLVMIAIVMAILWQMTGIWLSFAVTEMVTLCISYPLLRHYFFKADSL